MQIELNYENVSKLKDWIAVSIASFTTIEWLLYFFNRRLYYYWERLYDWIPWLLRQVYMFQLLTFFFVLQFCLLSFLSFKFLNKIVIHLKSK